MNFNKTLKSNKKNKPKWLFKKDYVEEFVEKYKNFNIFVFNADGRFIVFLNSNFSLTKKPMFLALKSNLLVHLIILGQLRLSFLTS